LARIEFLDQRFKTGGDEIVLPWPGMEDVARGLPNG
jgi:hypothetical protein